MAYKLLTPRVGCDRTLFDQGSRINVYDTYAHALLLGATGLLALKDVPEDGLLVQASIELQDLTFKAVDYGDIGEEITISYIDTVSAGHEVAVVTGKHIQIAIEDGVSTATQVKAAFDAESDATDIATCTITGTGGTAQDINNPIFLKGGADADNLAPASAAAVVVGDLTITALVGADGNDISFTLIPGGTTGAEAVTVTGTDIQVQIHDGVSTATQIKAALDAETDFTDIASCAISGTASAAQDVEIEIDLRDGAGAEIVQVALTTGVPIQPDGTVRFFVNDSNTDCYLMCDGIFDAPRRIKIV